MAISILGIFAHPDDEVTVGPLLARYAREHNGTNVLALGATLTTPEEAQAILAIWLSTPMREPRYLRRLAKIKALERRS